MSRAVCCVDARTIALVDNFSTEFEDVSIGLHQNLGFSSDGQRLRVLTMVVMFKVYTTVRMKVQVQTQKVEVVKEFHIGFPYTYLYT